MHDVYKGEYCMKKFRKSLREHAMHIINFEKRKMILLTNEEYESYVNQTNCRICKKGLNICNDNYHKIKDH